MFWDAVSSVVVQSRGVGFALLSRDSALKAVLEVLEELV